MTTATLQPTNHRTADAHPRVRKLVLRTFQSPGDVLLLTAAVRDLHLAYPRKFQTDVRTSAPDIWLNNPFVTPLEEHGEDVERMDMHYPLIHQSDRRPYHFIHGYVQYLEQQLGVPIPLTRFAGDIHLSPEEKRAARPFAELSVKDGFWIVMAGGKYDFTAKWWNPASYQAVVDHFQGRIQFVQCGEAGHFHPRLKGVIDLVGKTTLRQFILLMHHADGVLCPVTFAMHLAAAVETRPGKPQHRACVVVAGGREPAHWEQYPHHQFLTTVGMLPCCSTGACWRSRCQLVGDGDSKDREHVCERPVQVTSELRIPRCQEMITPADVIRRIEIHYEEGVWKYLPEDDGKGPEVGGQGLGTAAASSAENEIHAVESAESDTPAPVTAIVFSQPEPLPILIDFRHGLGDAVQLTTVLAHLRHYHPEWAIDVAVGVGKGSAYKGLARNIFVRDQQPIDRALYRQCFDLRWDECPTSYANCPSTKAEHCLKSVFGLEPIKELCRYQIPVAADAKAAAQTYLESICGPGRGPDGRYPAVLIHYQANTSTDKKDLPHEQIRRLCDEILSAGFVPVILDWDHRTPLADGVRVHCPTADMALWGDTGTGDAETLAALVEQASLMIGVDSGPLHVAGATTTQTIAVWTGHHPLHYFDLADNVIHLVPEHHESLLRGDRSVGRTFFEKHYPHQTYTRLDEALARLVCVTLPGEEAGLVRSHQFWVRRDNVEQDLVIVRDIAEQDSYRIAELAVPGPVAVDVGAHIGVFSRAFRRRHPSARVVAVECCPENIPALERNVGDFATIIPAALTYEKDVALLNAVYPGCVSTGGSAVISRSELNRLLGRDEQEHDQEARKKGGGENASNSPRTPAPELPYWLDGRPLRTITLEKLMAQAGLDRIDVLKLDCEGSEFSILDNTTSLDRISAIIGEYHGRERFDELVRRKFFDWPLRILREGDPGTFWLTNPHFLGRKSQHVSRTQTSADDLWQRFQQIVHPVDEPIPAEWQRYYTTLFELAGELRPRRICEIGVRAGYSAFAMLSACPQATMLGVEADLDEATHNTHGGRKGLFKHAEKILAEFDYQLLLADSRSLDRLPRCDLVYIDGDHSLEGCLADLRLAERSTNCILVDDYDSIQSVREACDRFAAEHAEFIPRHMDNGLTGLLLLRRAGAAHPPPV